MDEVEDLAPRDIATRLAGGVLSRPLTDDQAIELAKVYAALAIAEALNKISETKETP